MPQPFTGPLVNMMLILTVLLLGPLAGVALGAITPLVALFRGQLPPALLPLVPFIAIGNALLVVIFSWINKRWHGGRLLLLRVSSWAGIILGAAAKFIWLTMSVYFILPAVLGVQLPDAIVVMPQLFTALIGGALALVIFELFQRRCL